MQKTNICLNSIELVKQFATIAEKQECDIDIKCGHYLVDGKSILGIFSMDLTKELTLIIHSDHIEIMEKFRKFIV